MYHLEGDTIDIGRPIKPKLTIFLLCENKDIYLKNLVKYLDEKRWYTNSRNIFTLIKDELE